MQAISMPHRNLDKLFETELLPHADALHNFAYHLTRSEADADDLVQETFMSAFKALSSYREGTNARAWLFTILRNAFINKYRKTKNAPKQLDLDELTHFHNEEDTPYSSFLDLRDEMFNHLMGDEVTLAIKKLPEEFSNVIVLCDLEGFRYDEIANILEIPVGTVRSRLFRGRNMLKEVLRTYAHSLGYKDKRKK